MESYQLLGAILFAELVVIAQQPLIRPGTRNGPDRSRALDRRSRCPPETLDRRTSVQVLPRAPNLLVWIFLASELYLAVVGTS